MSSVAGLQRYRHVSVLGRGGMATVTLAEDTLLGRPVALKRVLVSADDDSGALRERAAGVPRLRREALLAARLNHPNLVAIYDIVSTDEDDVVLVMEYVEGETLAHRLARVGRLDPRVAVELLADIAAGLDHIHRHGIIHRDLKPANVLLGRDGAVKLADFGIAIEADITRVTNAGDVMGTYRYMAPEQLENEQLTPAVDIYALAAVAFELLSGQKARAEDNPLALAHAIATAPPPDLRAAWPEAPVAAARVLAGAMARDPAARPASANELVRRLARALTPSRPTARPVPAQPLATPGPARPAGEPRPARVPAPPPRRQTRSRERQRRWPLRAAGLALTLAAILAIVVSAGGDHGAAHRDLHAATTPAPAGASVPTAAPAPPSSVPAAPAPVPATAAGAGSPAQAVERFYHLAAAQQETASWALADPALRAQLGGFSSFAAGQAQDRAVNFRSIATTAVSSTAATVALATTSVHTDGTVRCSGTVDLVRTGAGGDWLLHRIAINCS